MQRFYFHLRTADGEQIRDDEGMELPSVAAARDEAIASAREMIANDVKNDGRVPDGRTFEIMDEEGSLLETLYFADVLWA